MLFKTIFASFKKSFQLKKIYGRIEEIPTVELIGKIIEIGINDPAVFEVMNKYRPDAGDFLNIYEILTLHGAGQHTKGHYVAVSALVYPQTLDFVLQHYQDGAFHIEGMNSYNASLAICNRLIKYFEKGETGIISDL